MGAISLRLPDEVESRLAEEARLEGRPRSEVVREAIVEYVARRERERFMAEMAAEARAAYDNATLRRETFELAEEAIQTSNDALDLAEGRKAGDPWPEESGEKWWR
jgi:predicted transcriptional regulator